MDYMHKRDVMWKYTSPWNSDRHPGSTMSASPLAIKLFSSELFGKFSGANTTKFVVWKGFNVLLLIGIMITPGGYSWKKPNFILHQIINIMTLKDKKQASSFSFLCTEISRCSYVLGLKSIELLKINSMCYSFGECFCPFNPKALNKVNEQICQRRYRKAVKI